MSKKINSIDKVKKALTLIRKKSKTKFPKELWDSIINLTHTHSFQEVCESLQISPVYLKRKICQSQNTNSLDFQEISMPAISSPEIVVIELNSSSGLSARIQGPLNCLNCIYTLFKG